MRKFFIIISISLILGSFSAGIIVGAFKYPPYDLVNYIYDKFNKIEQNTGAHSLYQQVDVSSIIRIKSESDIETTRSELIHYIWKQQELPYEKMPSEVETIQDNRFPKMSNLAKIDKITTQMEYGIESGAYLFLAQNSNRKLVIYHQGHDGDFGLGQNTIQYFLDKGYSVLAFSMPLLGSNNQPVIHLPNGKLKLTSHDDFKFLESELFSPIKLFVEPITVSLNYVDKNHNFDSYYMVGISGGGWTTVMYAALDPRIEKSYPVAGSVPMYLRYNNPNNMGDYEQSLPDLYKIADYLDLYILGSFGEGRTQLQVFNKNDPCCFSGTAYKTYENIIQDSIANLGKGQFKVFLDEKNLEHSISAESLDVISKNMESG
jgi:hypothetical protein